MANTTAVTAIVRLGYNIPYGAEWKGDYDTLVQRLDAVIGNQVRTLAAGAATLTIATAFTYARSTISASTITIPTNTSVAIPIGSEYTYRQTATGAVTFTPASGVTLNLPLGVATAVTRGAGDTMKLKKVATNEWDLIASGVA